MNRDVSHRLVAQAVDILAVDWRVAMKSGGQITVRRLSTRPRTAALALAVLLAYPVSLLCVCRQPVGARTDCFSHLNRSSSVPHSISAVCCTVHRSADQQRILRSQTLNDFLASSQEFPTPATVPPPTQILADRNAANALSHPVSPPLPPLLRSCILLI
jgi:hypothetical protein